jgi:hypothetical protein
MQFRFFLHFFFQHAFVNNQQLEISVLSEIVISEFARMVLLAGSFKSTVARSLASGDPLMILETLPCLKSIENCIPLFYRFLPFQNLCGSDQAFGFLLKSFSSDILIWAGICSKRETYIILVS